MLTRRLVNSTKLAHRYPGLFARDEAERRLHFAIRYAWHWHSYRKSARYLLRKTRLHNATGSTKKPASAHGKSAKKLVPSVDRVRTTNSNVVSITYKVVLPILQQK